MPRRGRATPGAMPGVGPRAGMAGNKAFKKMGFGQTGGAGTGFGAATGKAGGMFKAFQAARMKKGLAGKGGGY